jgi:hypothetical protein
MKKTDIIKKYPELRKSLKKIHRGSLYLYVPPLITRGGLKNLILVTHFYKKGIKIKVLATNDYSLSKRPFKTILYTGINNIKEEVPMRNLPLYISSATKLYKEYLKTLDLNKVL